jgi:hypothetical protein
MQAFLLKLLVAAVQNPDIRAFLLEVVDRLAATLLPKLASVIPVAIGAAAARFGDILGHVDLPSAPEIVEDIRKEVNHALPDGIDIPILSDAFEKVTGIDLTDILTGRKH